MSNVPVWWDKTITIYNKFIDPTTQRVSWYRNVVENCFWKNVNETYFVGTRGISSLGIQLETKDVICRIPQDERFARKREWKELEDRTNYFTFDNGDIIVLGEVDDVIDEYTQGQRSTDLVAKYKQYDECIEVSKYVINTDTGVTIPHYRVIGA